MSRQYVSIKFHESDRRSYMYHNDGPEVAVGDMVDVAGRADKPVSVKVLMTTFGKPDFATKPIIGKTKRLDGKLL